MQPATATLDIHREASSSAVVPSQPSCQLLLRESSNLDVAALRIQYLVEDGRATSPGSCLSRGRPLLQPLYQDLLLAVLLYNGSLLLHLLAVLPGGGAGLVLVGQLPLQTALMPRT